MFFDKQELQLKTKPNTPDAAFARRLQEVLGGQYGEITVAMQYGFQGWNSKMPGNYRDLLLAAAQLREEGHEDLPVPSNFPQKKEATDYSYQYLNFSDGAAASEGSWASGPTPDGNGEFSYHDGPTSTAPMPAPPVKVDPRLYGTTPNPNPVEKVTAKVKDVLGS